MSRVSTRLRVDLIDILLVGDRIGIVDIHIKNIYHVNWQIRLT